MTNIRAMLNSNDVSEYLKISPHGLEVGYILIYCEIPLEDSSISVFSLCSHFFLPRDQQGNISKLVSN